jgi:enamine deaminase RidA (YjgF/YER057c/UK114 family)
MSLPEPRRGARRYFQPRTERKFMSSIKRVNVDKRLSDMAIYNGVAYLAGQVPDDASLDITGQTAQVLATIDKLLAEAGTDKTKILMAQIFIANMKEFDGMNKAWDAWVAPGNAPPRATVEARLANPDYKVEIVVTAAVA